MIDLKRMLCAAVLSCSVTMSGAGFAAAQVESASIPPLTIALPLAGETADGAGCKTSEAFKDENARTYAGHLTERFNTDVVLCLTDTLEEAADLARRGEVNMAWVDQASAAPIQATWRSSLTLRSKTGLGRPPFVLFGKAGNDLKLANVDTDKIGFLDRQPHSLNVDLAQRLLNDFGMPSEAISEVARFKTIDALFAAVDDGRLETAILEAGSWGRACAVLEADSTLCDGFEVLIYDRPRAEWAFMIPNDTEVERHYRLVGVHIALHIDHPQVFGWLSQGRGQEFDPTEPVAILPKSADRAVVF